jgi:hypothetical protein
LNGKDDLIKPIESSPDVEVLPISAQLSPRWNTKSRVILDIDTEKGCPIRMPQIDDTLPESIILSHIELSPMVQEQIKEEKPGEPCDEVEKE